MKSVLSSSRTLLLAAVAAGVFAAPWPVTAQQAPSSPAPAAAPAAPVATQTTTPPPSWMQGAPSAAEESHLAPQVPPPIPTAADKLPVAELKLPKNFHLEVFASGVGNARSLRVGDKGTVFVSTRTLDRIYAIVDNNGKRDVKVLATGLNSPNGIALHNGTLYIAEINRISKIDNVESQLDNPPKPTAIYSDLPNDAPHGWKFLTVGPTTSSISTSVRRATTACRRRPTPRSVGSISTAAGWRSSPAASARSSAWIGIRC